MTGSTTGFKVGEKVKVTKQANRNGQLSPSADYIGAVGEIAAVARDGIWVKFEGRPGLSFHANQLTPMNA
jgi:hypothetical protein